VEVEPTSLYLVPTPIGNLKDITLRALEILKSADAVLAEDTRVTSKLLNHYDIKTKLISFHAHNEHKVISNIIEELKLGKVYAQVSDAGSPAISDPGFLLVREALAEGIKIESLPGATAFVPALIKSGFSSERFIFEGFLPHKKGRQKRITSLLEEERTMIFYESPYRLLKTLEQFTACFGEERKVSVSRELTKIYEETITGTLPEVIEYYKKSTIKGEIVLVLEGKS
jgi:16S rRNA (cytidine1402-2'-O)-methyltransferase